MYRALAKVSCISWCECMIRARWAGVARVGNGYVDGSMPPIRNEAVGMIYWVSGHPFCEGSPQGIIDTSRSIPFIGPPKAMEYGIEYIAIIVNGRYKIKCPTNPDPSLSEAPVGTLP